MLIKVSATTRIGAGHHAWALYQCPVCFETAERQCHAKMPPMCKKCTWKAKAERQHQFIYEGGTPLYARKLLTDVVACLCSCERHEMLWAAGVVDEFITKHGG